MNKSEKKIDKREKEKPESKRRELAKAEAGADAHADVGLYDPCRIHLFKKNRNDYV